MTPETFKVLRSEFPKIDVSACWERALSKHNGKVKTGRFVWWVINDEEIRLDDVKEAEEVQRQLNELGQENMVTTDRQYEENDTPEQREQKVATLKAAAEQARVNAIPGTGHAKLHLEEMSQAFRHKPDRRSY